MDTTDPRRHDRAFPEAHEHAAHPAATHPSAAGAGPSAAPAF